MHILITGAAGMIGRKLTERLVVERSLHGQPIDKLTLIDIVAPARPASFSDHVKTRAADLTEPGVAAKAVSERPDVIFHLAGVVSGEAEVDLEKGYRVNLDGSRELLDAIRAAGDGYRPRVVFTSSMAVYGAPFPHASDRAIGCPRKPRGPTTSNLKAKVYDSYKTVSANGTAEIITRPFPALESTCAGQSPKPSTSLEYFSSYRFHPPR